jgi:predicted ribosomally synthesized peptide with nif11-like leader
MSLQSARDFIKRIETNLGLKERLEAAPDYEARQQIVQEAGFDFTVEEFKQAVEELAAAACQELTPEELQDIAAGAGKIHWCPFHGWPRCPSYKACRWADV